MFLGIVVLKDIEKLSINTVMCIYNFTMVDGAHESLMKQTVKPVKILAATEYFFSF